jgi:hypothetical protein
MHKKEERTLEDNIDKLNLSVRDASLVSFRGIRSVCDFACTSFRRKYMLEDESIGYIGTVPKGIKSIEEEGLDLKGNIIKVQKKFWFLQEIKGLSIEESMDAFVKANYTLDDYWSVFSMSKASTFHSAFILAIRELELNHGYKFTYEGKEVSMYGLANVIVKKPFDYLVPVFNWANKDSTMWDCDRSHNISTQLVWLRLSDGSRILLSFTAPMHGIYSYNEGGFPLWIEDEAKQNYFEVHQLIMPSEVEKIVLVGLKDSATSKDIRPKITLSCKFDIVTKILDESS